jgi:hypothetical protein
VDYIDKTGRVDWVDWVGYADKTGRVDWVDWVADRVDRMDKSQNWVD